MLSVESGVIPLSKIPLSISDPKRNYDRFVALFPPKYHEMPTAFKTKVLNCHLRVEGSVLKMVGLVDTLYVHSPFEKQISASVKLLSSPYPSCLHAFLVLNNPFNKGFQRSLLGL